MSSFEQFLGLEKHADADATWGAGNRLDRDAIGYAMSGQRLMEVDPHWTTGNLYPGAGSPSTERRKFNLIQDAIDAAELAGWGGTTGYTILLNPGSYDENIVIKKSVTIASRMGANGGFYPHTVKIRGKTTVKASTVEISPADGVFVYVMFTGIAFENQYNQPQASEITVPYLIDAQDQSSYSGTRSKIILKDCMARLQTWGGDGNDGGNIWTYGIKAKGQYHMIIHGCQMTCLKHGGGQQDGIIRRLFDVRGNDAQAKTSLLGVKFCALDNLSHNDGTAPILFYMDDRSVLTVNHTVSPRQLADLFTDGGTGTNSRFGVQSGDAIAYSNGWGTTGSVVIM